MANGCSDDASRFVLWIARVLDPRGDAIVRARDRGRPAELIRRGPRSDRVPRHAVVGDEPFIDQCPTPARRRRGPDDGRSGRLRRGEVGGECHARDRGRRRGRFLRGRGDDRKWIFSNSGNCIDADVARTGACLARCAPTRRCARPERRWLAASRTSVMWTSRVALTRSHWRTRPSWYSYGALPPVAVAVHRITVPGALGAAASGARETVVDSGGGAVEDGGGVVEDGALILSV